MMNFNPIFTITPKIAYALMRIEAAKQSIQNLPITVATLSSLRETARLISTHYSTMIEGNRLTQEEVTKVIETQEHFPGRERDEKEVLGYYAGLSEVEKLVNNNSSISEIHIQHLHALVMAGGRKKVKPTVYRDGQNVIRDSASRRIVYMPPEAKDVPHLMKAFVRWINSSELPCPLRASIAHYQYATIHPYYDGNGRTARLLTTLILHLGGYDLNGLYSLEEYYARHLGAYYEALTVGPSHNYYLGRAETDITQWIEYFCDGMVESFEAVKKHAQKAADAGIKDHSTILKKLDARQRKALILFQESETISNKDIEKLFNLSERAARNICTEWVKDGFLVMESTARKNRRYILAKVFKL
jgi:Fic family protein